MSMYYNLDQMDPLNTGTIGIPQLNGNQHPHPGPGIPEDTVGHGLGDQPLPPYPQNAEFQKLSSVVVDERFGVCAVGIDLHEELVWMGNMGGHVTSYYGNNLEKYTSFQVHPTQEIRQILTAPDFLLILTQNILRIQLRRGLPVFTHSAENMGQMQCMLMTSPTKVLMGGHQHELIEFDLGRMSQASAFSLPSSGSGCAILRTQGRLIYSGEPSGQIHLLDSRTFRQEQTIESHSGSLSDFDVHGNLMVTCGFSSRHGNLSVDRFLKVYDIRSLRALAPIPVSIDPFLLRFLPSFSSRIATVSAGGQMEILETQAVSESNICLYQVTTPPSSLCQCFDVSSSCHQLVFGDTTGNLHLFSSNPTAMFNSFSRDTEFPDPVPTLPLISFTDENASFASVPVFFPQVSNSNHPTASYLSDWPEEFYNHVYRKIPEINPNILASMKMVGTIGYAPNPGTHKRNEMAYNNMTNNNQNLSSTTTSVPNLSPTTTNGQLNNNSNNMHHLHNNLPVSPSHNNRMQNGMMNLNLGQWNGQPGPQQFNGSVTNGNGHNGGGSNLGSPVRHMHLPPIGPMPPFPPPYFGPGPPPPHMMPPTGPPHMMPHPPPHMMQNCPGPLPLPPRPPPFFHNNNPKSSSGPFSHKNTTFHPGGASKRQVFHGMSGSTSTSKYQIPKRYTKYDWKKHFFEESDMESFNRTKFAGLESTQANSYSNSILQILYHIPHLRAGLLSHLCQKEACLSCELGFLFHMLDKTKTIPCIASNFLRAFRLVPEASALGLILQESQSKQRGTFLRLVQSFNRFILHQIDSETKEDDKIYPISQLFAMRQENVVRCTRCLKEERKESTVLLSNILYTPDANGGGKRCTFIDLVQRSLCPEQTTPAWCEKCSKYIHTYQSRLPKCLPSILSFNTCLDNAHDFQLWRNHMELLLPEKCGKSDVEGTKQNGPTKVCRYGRSCMRADCKFWHEGRPGTEIVRVEYHGKTTDFELNPEMQVKWLPTKLRVSIDENKKVSCMDLENDTLKSLVPLDPTKIEQEQVGDYELISVTCFIRDPELEEKNNLVSFIRVDGSYYERANQVEGEGKNNNWFLFNDFCIREAPVSEACSFNPKWKIPCVIYYSKILPHRPEELRPTPSINPTVTIDIFRKPTKPNKNGKLTYKPLDIKEIEDGLDYVGIDSEYVTLGQEETELRSDGKLATIRPQQMTVARVTCIRGHGPLEGTPFIDDYISTQEVVVDYLTKFSGIKPGDLDVKYSEKNVTILKEIYLKLRFLVDTGVKFVGHGLCNDFRVINLTVPQDQIIDTVSLFYLPSQRMISLRFLAWHFLGIIIQSEVHDSTEDANTALLLYRKYEQLKSEGKLQGAVEELYDLGKKLQWKVPTTTQLSTPQKLTLTIGTGISSTRTIQNQQEQNTGKDEEKSTDKE